jgi:hypothetical protein
MAIMHRNIGILVGYRIKINYLKMHIFLLQSADIAHVYAAVDRMKSSNRHKNKSIIRYKGGDNNNNYYYYII